MTPANPTAPATCRIWWKARATRPHGPSLACYGATTRRRERAHVPLQKLTIPNLQLVSVSPDHAPLAKVDRLREATAYFVACVAILTPATGFLFRRWHLSRKEPRTGLAVRDGTLNDEGPRNFRGAPSRRRRLRSRQVTRRSAKSRAYAARSTTLGTFPRLATDAPMPLSEL